MAEGIHTRLQRGGPLLGGVSFLSHKLGGHVGTQDYITGSEAIKASGKSMEVGVWKTWIQQIQPLPV